MIDERLHIEDLLKRFMQGETTLDEERELGDWLRTHEVDDTLRPYQQMFAAFDAGMPWVQPTPPRRRIAWWHWAAAAAVAALLAIGLTLQHPRPTPTMPQPPVTAQAQPDTAVEKVADKAERLAEIRQANPTAIANPKARVRTTKNSKPAKLTQQDSVEVTRTAGDLELAESEYLAEQLELEQELHELRRQHIAQQSGWHYTSLPCQ
ncbi:MAG: hypothetical protein IJ724_10325 [Muribaculaceae bacterium]|nr:hypothetical protein [Muribaculaceae bacterium]MBR1727020.1 hypothetical protein [Muribaculaceae bacterium]